MAAEHLLQRIVEQVGGGVVGSRCVALVGVDASHEVGLDVLGQFLDDMYALVVLALGVDDVDGLVLRYQGALVAHLATHLAVERRMVEHHLVECVLLLCDLAVAQDVALILGVVVTHELLFAILDLHPVTVLHGSGVAGACLLLGHLAVEALLVDGETVLAADQFGEVERETVGVEEAESLLAVELRLGVLLQFVHVAVEQLDALLQGAQEAVFLLLDDTADELLLCGQFGVSAAHLMNEHGNELIHERSLLVEERVGVAHGAAQDAADDIASLGVAGQLAVGDGESHGSEVVGHYADGDVDLLLSVGALAVGSFGEGVAVFLAREVLDLGDDGREDVGVVVGTLALHEAHQALEAHARIDDVHLQRLQAAVGLAVILHEHDVPNLDNLRMVLVDQFLARHLGLLFLRAEVDVDLRAGTAGACVAHLPEVVVLVSVDDVVLGEMLCPVAGSLVVAAEVLAGVALKHGDV